MILRKSAAAFLSIAFLINTAFAGNLNEVAQMQTEAKEAVAKIKTTSNADASLFIGYGIAASILGYSIKEIAKQNKAIKVARAETQAKIALESELQSAHVAARHYAIETSNMELYNVITKTSPAKLAETLEVYELTKNIETLKAANAKPIVIKRLDVLRTIADRTTDDYRYSKSYAYTEAVEALVGKHTPAVNAPLLRIQRDIMISQIESPLKRHIISNHSLITEFFEARVAGGNNLFKAASPARKRFLAAKGMGMGAGAVAALLLIAFADDLAQTDAKKARLYANFNNFLNADEDALKIVADDNMLKEHVAMQTNTLKLLAAMPEAEMKATISAVQKDNDKKASTLDFDDVKQNAKPVNLKKYGLNL